MKKAPAKPAAKVPARRKPAAKAPVRKLAKVPAKVATPAKKAAPAKVKPAAKKVAKPAAKVETPAKRAHPNSPSIAPPGTVTELAPIDGTLPLVDDIGRWNLDAILSRVHAGHSLLRIAREGGVSHVALVDQLRRKPNWKTAVDQARRSVADLYADMAEEVLEILTSSASAAQMFRAKELANHYRWKAGKMEPQTYGEGLTLRGTGPGGSHLVRPLAAVPTSDLHAALERLGVKL